MKHLALRLIAITTFCGSLALSTRLRADEYWNGGSGTWDFNNTPSWNAGTWTPNDQVANFNSIPGRVTVDETYGQVGDQQLNFGSGSTSPWDITGGSLAVSGNTNVIVYNGGNGNVTIGSEMDVDTTRSTDRYNIINDGTTLNLDGNIVFGAQSPSTDSGRSLIIGSGSNNSVINLNGTFSDSFGSGGVSINLRLAEGGATLDTYNINGNLSGLSGGMQIGSGNVIVGPTAVLPPGTVFMYDDQGYASENVALLTSQGSTISNSAYISMKYDSGGLFGAGTIGGSDATNSVFSGGVGLDNSGLIVKAASGGRVTFSGTGGNIGGHSPNGIIKTGAGTVVFAQSSGNGYGTNNDFSPTPGSVAMDIQQGVLLITNATGSAFGGNTSATANVESGATLGGTGISAQPVIAEAPGSIIAPGDPGQSSLSIAPSLGTLHLAGGLSAPTGLTLSFKLDGALGDKLDLGAGAFSLSGPVTVNFTDIGVDSVLPGADYILATGSGSWSDAGATFDINAPDGLYVQSYDFNTSSDTFDVEFKVAPEPSTWALVGVGILVLFWRVRRKNATASEQA